MEDTEEIHMTFEPGRSFLSITIKTACDGRVLTYTAGAELRTALRNETMLADGRTMGQALQDDMRTRLQEFIDHNKGHDHGNPQV